MNRNQDTKIRAADAKDLDRVRPLWELLYQHQREHGLVANLATDGFERWSRAIVPLMGRFGCLFVAEHGAEMIGFLAGRIKSPTPPFDPAPVGHVSDVFVAPSQRRGGVGRRLLQAAGDWFAQQGIVRMELQVLSDNHIAREMYRRVGWQEELVQLVYRIDPGPVGQK